MSQIKQLIILHSQRKSIRSIAKQLNMSKNTVKRYIEKMTSLQMTPKQLLDLDDPMLNRIFHAGNPAYNDRRFEYLQNQLDKYAEDLKRTGVTRLLLWEEYLMEQPDGYGYTQFCYHLNQHILRKNPTMMLEHKPAEDLFVDFAGHTTSYIDRSTGEIVRCQIFVACLPYSDYGFAIAVPSQKQEDFLDALQKCLLFLGGSPKVLVTDNLKAAVTRTHRYEPDINQALQDFANHYKMALKPTRAYKPKDKALVENHVKMFYTHVFARMRNEQHFDLLSLNKAIEQRVIHHNQTRMQRKPFSRYECFLSEEKELLQPLPIEPFETKTYSKHKVASNNFIYLARTKRYYSVPYQHIGRRVEVVLTKSMVKVYFAGDVIAQHLRSKEAGNLYVYQDDHLCSSHRHYKERSPAYYIKRSLAISPLFGKLIELKFDTNQPPETLYKSCEGLISTAKKADRDILELACEIAITNGNYSMKYLQNILKNRTYYLKQPQQQPPLPKHSNIRGKAYYESQLTLNLLFTNNNKNL